MRARRFGKTGWQVSEIGFGSWAIGGEWGEVSEADAEAALHAALDSGVTLIDTADVYGDGRSERIIARVLRARRDVEDIRVLTKAGRRLDPHVASGYKPWATPAHHRRGEANQELHGDLDMLFPNHNAVRLLRQALGRIVPPTPPTPPATPL